METSVFIINVFAYCMLVTLALLLIGLKSPRLMLQDYPKSIQNATSPKTSEEKKLGIIYGLPFLSVFIGYPICIGIYTAGFNNEFWEIFKYVYLLLFIGNAYDLLVLDWLIICYITPKFVVISGTEGNAGYKDYRFHFIGFLKGLVITLILTLIISGIVKFMV